MVILEKKRILLLTSLIAVTMFVCILGLNNTENILGENTPVVALPVSQKTIVIDAGHGIPDEGAQSSTRNNRSTNEFENCFKSTKFIRTKWFNSYINKK